MAAASALFEEAAVDLTIQPLYFAAVVVLWLLVYHVVYRLVAIARDPSLVFWSVGLFGVSAVSLREPPARRILAQLAIAGTVLALVAYVCLFLLHPAPVGGLDHSPRAELAAALAPVAALTLVRLLAIWRDRRYPLWGEARVLTAAQRSLATGARIFFTSSGRRFVHERFGATPHEFLRMVRY